MEISLSNELSSDSTVRKFRIVKNEGKRKDYSL